MKFHFFGPVLTLLCAAMNWYSASWCLRAFKPSPRASRAVLAAFAVLALAFPSAHPLENALGGGLGRAWLWFGSFCLGAGLIIFTVLLAADLLRLALKAAGVSVPARPYALGALLAAAGLTALAVVNGAGAPRVREVPVELSGLPPALEGFRIVQVSDFHLGRLNGADRFRRLLGQINALKPDLAVFTGDMTERGGALPEDACAAAGAIEARYGAAAVLGNHDLFSGAPDLFARCGVRTLRGEVYEAAPGLLVGGVDDLRRAPLTPAAAAAVGAKLLRPGKGALLLSHQPQGWESITGGRPSLVLSGHTHAGQIFPFNLIERPFFKYFYGLYRDRETRIYVTSGAGTWGPPMRLFTESELPLFTLRAAPGK